MTNKYNIKKTQTYNIQKKRKDKIKSEELKIITKNNTPLCAIFDDYDCDKCYYNPDIDYCCIFLIFEDHPNLKIFFKNKKGE